MPSSSSAQSPTKKKSKSEKSFSLISDETFRRMYAAMLGCRLIEERGRRELRSRRSSKKKTISLQATKPLLGQEAVIVGSTLELRPDDTITVPSGEVIFREPPANKPLGKAAQAQQALMESRRNVIAFAVSTGAQLTIGTGVALAQKDSEKGNIVVSFGDADIDSIESWSEALHLAGAHQLPIIFVLRPDFAQPTSVEAICQQAALSGVTTIPVDYTDVVAIYRVSFESIARARRGTGATLIVCTEFAVDGHAASKKEQATDPIKRMEAYLTTKGIFSPKWKAQVLRQVK
jgi:TPP-dependent pyruvate/acetoin dehydrogenase alpha subunit